MARHRASDGPGHPRRAESATDDVPVVSSADADLRSRANGALFWVANIGAVASAAAGAAGLPLRALFATQAAATTAAFVLTWILPRNLGAIDSLPAVPDSQRPTAADTRHSRRDARLLLLAFVPATMLMFQAFGGLAVAMPPEAYRLMVLVNAITLVLAQPLSAPVLRLFGATAVSIAAITAMAVGIAAQTFWPWGLGWTTLWSLGELMVVIVPGALIAAAAPTAEVAVHVGRFQVAQGLAAAGALRRSAPRGFRRRELCVGLSDRREPWHRRCARGASSHPSGVETAVDV